MRYPGDAYVAGLIDGEGCIWIQQTARESGTTYRPVVEIGMTVKALPLLRSLAEELGGKIHFARRATEKWEEAHKWSVGGPVAAAVLKRMEPFLVLKKEHARLGIRVEEIRQSLSWSSSRCAIWTDEARDRCEIIKLRVKELNATGPQRKCRPPENGKEIARLAAGQWLDMNKPSLFSDLGFLPYSRTWPKWGSMRSGVAYELPEPGLRTEESASSFSPLPTPVARDYKGIPGKNVQMASLPREISLLPTPNTMDSLPPKTREQIQAHRKAGKGGDRNLREVILYELPDPGDHTRVDWGKYGNAIRRWEGVMKRPAPFPTEPGENNPRLSPALSEFLMGFPEGWVTRVPGLTRADQLRIIGNGCVPQQAAMALRILLDRMEST
jgi:hypothetical protein